MESPPCSGNGLSGQDPSLNDAYSTESSHNEQCIEVEKWSVGVALGLGAKSNPIEGGDAIPQVLLLDIAWYGDNAYFDNGELGFRWIQKQSFSAESYITLDRERAFFSFLDPANILVNTGVAVPDSPTDPVDPNVNPPVDEPDVDELESVSLDEIQRRKWALLAGIKAQYYNGSHKWSLSLESDITGVHSGQRVTVSYQKMWSGDDWRFQLRPSVVYKSDNLIDYYYGLDAEDEVVSSLFYEGKGGFQPSLSALYIKDVNDDWRFIVNASYQRLNKGMTDSPLVVKNQVTSLFVGFGYRF